MTVREQLRLAYVRSGRTLVDISAESGVSESTILNIFRGRNVTASNLFAVCSALGVRHVEVPYREMSA